MTQSMISIRSQQKPSDGGTVAGSEIVGAGSGTGEDRGGGVGPGTCSRTGQGRGGGVGPGSRTGTVTGIGTGSRRGGKLWKSQFRQ